jgi:N-acetylglucosamine malate deacetylase 1
MAIDGIDILAIGAHPDDIELTCAGLLLRAKQAGARIGVVDLSRGELGSRGSRESREQEAAAATEVLGLDLRLNLDLPDGGIAHTPANVRNLVEVIRRWRPKLLLGPFWEDHHPDHVATSLLVKDAWWFAGVVRYPGRGPAHRPERVLHYHTRYDFRPSLIVDISEVYEIKKRAVSCYHSQLHSVGGGAEPETFLSTPDFLLHWEGKQRFFGAQIGVAFGEAYYLQTPVPVYDPLSLVAPAARSTIVDCP